MCVSALGFGQTGPGGVGNAASVFAWWDANNETLANGSAVSTFTDRMNGRDLSQSVNSRKPTFNTNQINGKSAISFDGINNFLTLDNDGGALSGIAGRSYFSVATSSNVGTQFYFHNTFNSNIGTVYEYQVNNSTRGLLQQSQSPNIYKLFQTNTAAIPVRIGSILCDGSNTSLKVKINGSQIGSSNAIGPALSGTFSNLTVGKMNVFSQYYLNGLIGDLIILRFTTNTTQTNIIENYLAAKYNITIANDKYAYQAAHGNEVAGIGRESIGDLHTDAQGSSIVRINGADDLEDGEYMLWGHDGAGTGTNTTEVPATYTVGTSQRLDQEWRVDISGGDNTVGSVDISFDLTGISFGVNPDEFRVLIDGDGNFLNATVDGTVPTVVGSVISFANITFSDGDYFTLGNSNIVDDCLSFSTSNWQSVFWSCGTVPDSTNNVTISDGTTVTIPGGTTESANDLFIEADGGGGGGSLVVAANATLIIKGDIDYDNNSSFTFATGAKLIMRGVNGTQTITNNSGNNLTFNNLVINNTNDVVLTGGHRYELTNGLTLSNGNLTNNSTFTFLSNAVSTAYVNPIPNGSVINGTGTQNVQRYRDGRVTDWGDIASSGVDTDIEDLDPDIYISGVVGGDGYAAAAGGGSFISFWYFDEVSDLYVAVGNTNEAFELGKGYEVYLGTDNVTWDPTTWTLTGDIHLDPISIAVNSAGGGNNWNLLGNPYPGYLDWSNITTTYNGIVNGEYWYSEAGTGFVTSTADLPAGQGFWIQTTGLASIDLDPSVDLVTDNNSSIYFKRNLNEELLVSVRNNNADFASAVYLRKDVMAYEGLDDRDITPIRLPDPRACNLSIEAGGQELMVNYVNTDVDRLEIPLVMETGLKGDYSLKIKGLDYFPEYQCAALFNDASGEQIFMDDETEYHFAVETPGNSKNFTLVLSKNDGDHCAPPTTSSELEEGVHVWTTSSTVLIDFDLSQSVVANIAIYNVLGELVHREITQAQFNRHSVSFHPSSAGIYFVTVEVNGNTITEKIILN